MTRRCEGEHATEEIGAMVGALVRPGDMIALDGDLGAGKTCFVRGLARGCGITVDVRSPTFVFHHVYAAHSITLHHIDCYRLGEGADLSFLDVDTLLDAGAVAVEWARYADLRAYRPVRVVIELLNGDERMISIDDPTGRYGRLAAEVGHP